MDIADIVRVGTVSVTDATTRRVRVIFDGMVSNWLFVVSAPSAMPSQTNSQAGGANEEAFASHAHGLPAAGAWFPRVNDTVLCLFIPIPDGDGFVLGAIK